MRYALAADSAPHNTRAREKTCEACPEVGVNLINLTSHPAMLKGLFFKDFLGIEVSILFVVLFFVRADIRASDGALCRTTLTVALYSNTRQTNKTV